MSEENAETFRKFVAAFHRGDTEAAQRLFHPDATFEPLRTQIQGPYRGHSGMRAFWEDTAENFESFHLDYTDIRDLGDDRVLAIGTIHVRGKGSGVETDIPTAGIATYRDGMLIHWKDFGERPAALEAAGLRE
jgi:ketosteroid isomerase-like protein